MRAGLGREKRAWKVLELPIEESASQELAGERKLTLVYNKCGYYPRILIF